MVGTGAAARRQIVVIIIIIRNLVVFATANPCLRLVLDSKILIFYCVQIALASVWYTHHQVYIYRASVGVRYVVASTVHIAVQTMYSLTVMAPVSLVAVPKSSRRHSCGAVCPVG